MPIMVLYKAAEIPNIASVPLSEAIAHVTASLLDAKIEVRVFEPIYMFNANEIHIEMRFRDFNEYNDDLLAKYHNAVMKKIGEVLKSNNIECAYSFYILPSLPPRSLWAQDKT